MSSNKRIPLDHAIALAAQAQELFGHLCQTKTVAGSIRREKETDGDIEFVVIPRNLQALLIRLDSLVEAGTIKKALYRYADKNGKSSYRPRWGEKLRCFWYQDATIELAIANENNYGYILWLRTGPAEANQYVMTRLSMDNAPLRFKDGYAWLCEYRGDTPYYRHKLHIPDEETFFQALGMNQVSPQWRSERLYKANWNSPAAAILEHMIIQDVKQRKLF